MKKGMELKALFTKNKTTFYGRHSFLNSEQGLNEKPEADVVMDDGQKRQQPMYHVLVKVKDAVSTSTELLTHRVVHPGQPQEARTQKAGEPLEEGPGTITRWPRDQKDGGGEPVVTLVTISEKGYGVCHMIKGKNTVLREISTQITCRCLNCFNLDYVTLYFYMVT